MRFLDAMHERVLVAEGAMGTRLFFKGIPQDACLEALNLTNPALIAEVHQEYRAAGADILKTNTFGANTVRLSEHNAEAKCREINIAAVRIAREVAGKTGFVAGAVGPLGSSIVSSPRRVFEIQIEALAKAGADLILLETFSDLEELHQALLAAHTISDLPVIAQVSTDEQGNLSDGVSAQTFAPRLVEWGADVIGCNCGSGPRQTLETISKVAAHADVPLSAQPSAGIPFYQNGQLQYAGVPEEMAEAAQQFIWLGARIVGGCCGTIPEHIAAIRSAVNSLRSSNAIRAAKSELQR